MIRVVLVDDHALVRAGVRAEIGDRVEVIGEAADAPGFGLATLQESLRVLSGRTMTIAPSERSIDRRSKTSAPDFRSGQNTFS